jgi:lactate dehydrogenase-like 2-hydroxyacid dehydrogenase
LIDALQTGKIGSPALDIHAQELDIDPRIMALENVILQPHYATLTHEARADTRDRTRSCHCFLPRWAPDVGAHQRFIYTDD